MPADSSAMPAPSSEYQVCGRGRSWRVGWVLLVPLVAFAGVLAAFYLLLGRDPHLVASPLIGRPVPQFSLPPVKRGHLGLSSADLRGEVSLVNVFASWCVACREEHPVLMQLHRSGTVAVHGIDYKDAPDDAARWLAAMGDPYTRTGADRDGRVAIDWGVYGVPVTVVDARGRIAYKQTGPITPQILDRIILPLIAKLRDSSGPAAK
jgi:cytochrome c biogenesis protein CcmG/thiol:disulfide interchange protein DsbE